MILKIWPDGNVVSEDESEQNMELNHGHSDDYFVIDMDKSSCFNAMSICTNHFQGEQLELVQESVMECYRYYENAYNDPQDVVKSEERFPVQYWVESGSEWPLHVKLTRYMISWMFVQNLINILKIKINNISYYPRKDGSWHAPY